MIGAIVAVLLVLAFGGGILRLTVKILIMTFSLMLSAATFVFKALCVFFGITAALIYMVLRQLIPFIGKNLAQAVPWVISAVVAISLTIYAFSRRIFHGEDAFAFIEKLIPREETSRRTELSLLVIELADSIHAELLAKYEAQVAQIRELFRPLDE